MIGFRQRYCRLDSFECLECGFADCWVRVMEELVERGQGGACVCFELPEGCRGNGSQVGSRILERADECRYDAGWIAIQISQGVGGYPGNMAVIVVEAFNQSSNGRRSVVCQFFVPGNKYNDQVPVMDG